MYWTPMSLQVRTGAWHESTYCSAVAFRYHKHFGAFDASLKSASAVAPARILDIESKYQIAVAPLGRRQVVTSGCVTPACLTSTRQGAVAPSRQKFHPTCSCDIAFMFATYVQDSSVEPTRNKHRHIGERPMTMPESAVALSPNCGCQVMCFYKHDRCFFSGDIQAGMPATS